MILWDVRVFSSLFLKGGNFFVHFFSFFTNKKQYSEKPKISNGSFNFAQSAPKKVEK